MDDQLWGLAVGAAIGGSVVVLARGLRQLLRSGPDEPGDDHRSDTPTDPRHPPHRNP